MAAYYYLISSLPTLRTDAPMPISYEEFLRQCKSAVNANTYKTLCTLDANSSESGISFVKQWTTFNGALMNELNRRRKEKFGKKVEANSDRNSEIEKVVNQALNAQNPLEAEKVLLDAQFSYLDSLVNMHFFDDNVLFGYAVKLRLLERQNVFDTEKGKQEFSGLYNSIHQQIMNIGLEN
ncbi:MAG: DUF2764 domain-containing protein [Sphaerochaetaceae bacterium]|nr:DUF2764 domain-containing protein [Sphaerochaetaceae bacterium]